LGAFQPRNGSRRRRRKRRRRREEKSSMNADSNPRPLS